MPIYRCYSPPGLLSAAMKAQIADEITTIHVDATRAPELFVNVLFQTIEETTALWTANHQPTPTCSA